MVLVYEPYVIAEIVSLMTYGAIVRYYHGGIEFEEMLGDEDYEVLFDLDDVIRELEEKNEH